MTKLGIYLTNGGEAVARACGSIEGVEVLSFPDAAALAAAAWDLDAAILQNGSYTAEMAAAVAASPRMKWIQAAAAGIDGFRARGVPERIALTAAGDVWSSSVADHAMALLLGLLRGLPTHERLRREGHWDRGPALKALGGISGRTVLIVGLGNIGRAIARRAQAFDMHVVGAVRTMPADAAAIAVDRIEPVDRLPALLADADAVILSVPLTAETRHLIDARALAAMKPSAVLVNVSRGEVIDQAALLDALATGRLMGAGLDVTDPEPLPKDHPLWACERIILSPHIAAFDDGPVFDKLGALCRENLQRLQTHRPFVNRVHL
jgi:phosphoglycerate dehydrogenase-like enzyme